MPNPENLKNFEKGNDPRRNLNGRPRKYVSQLTEQGYTRQEIDGTLKALLSMTADELKAVYENHSESTMLERTVSNAIYKALKSGDLTNIERILNRAFGSPKQEVEHLGNEDQPLTINIVRHVGK